MADGRDADIDRLRALAGLAAPSQSSAAQTRREFMRQVSVAPPTVVAVSRGLKNTGAAAIAGNNPFDLSLEDELLRDMQTACQIHHKKQQKPQADQVFNALDIFSSVARRARASRDTKAELRARLCASYIHYGIDEMNAAASESEELVKYAEQLALEEGDYYWKVAAEAEQLRGRISLKVEDYAKARWHFNSSDQFLRKIKEAPCTFDGGHIPRTGHSFIVAHDTEIARSTIHAGNLLFSAKTWILEALRSDRGWLPPYRHEDLAGKLLAAIKEDRADPGPNLGFDLLLLSQLEFDVEPGDAKSARSMLQESRDYFDSGAGRRDWYILSAHFAPKDRIARAMGYLENAAEYLSWFSLSGLAKWFDQLREIYEQYQPKRWKEHAFQSAFAAAVLLPYSSFHRRLQESAHILKSEERKPKEFGRLAQRLADEIVSFNGKFSVIRNVAGTLGDAVREKLARNAVAARNIYLVR
jgi:hypothetical protein